MFHSRISGRRQLLTVRRLSLCRPPSDISRRSDVNLSSGPTSAQRRQTNQSVQRRQAISQSVERLPNSDIWADGLMMALQIHIIINTYKQQVRFWKDLFLVTNTISGVRIRVWTLALNYSRHFLEPSSTLCVGRWNVNILFICRRTAW